MLDIWTSNSPQLLRISHPTDSGDNSPDFQAISTTFGPLQAPFTTGACPCDPISISVGSPGGGEQHGTGDLGCGLPQKLGAGDALLPRPSGGIVSPWNGKNNMLGLEWTPSWHGPRKNPLVNFFHSI